MRAASEGEIGRLDARELVSKSEGNSSAHECTSRCAWVALLTCGGDLSPGKKRPGVVPFASGYGRLEECVLSWRLACTDEGQHIIARKDAERGDKSMLAEQKPLAHGSNPFRRIVRFNLSRPARGTVTENAERPRLDG